MSRYFVTGCAGFIGSNLVDRLLAAGHEVVGYDNFSTGREEFLAEAAEEPAIFRSSVATCSIWIGSRRPCAGGRLRLPPGRQRRRPLRHRASPQGPGAEHDRHLPRAGGDAGQRRRRIAFSSTGSIYGEPEVFPTPETAPFPVQTSLYGASKLAGEGLIQAYCTGLWLSGIYLPLRLHPRRTLYPRTRRRLLP